MPSADRVKTTASNTTSPKHGANGSLDLERGGRRLCGVRVNMQRLVFFTTPKVACTAFKMLFRRMLGHADWRLHDPARGLPHDPLRNGLV